MIRFERKDNEFKGDFGAPVPLEIDTKAISETGEFEGYAAVYGNRDLGDDVILAGAFDESLRERPAAKIKMLWQHDTRKPIGVWTEFRSDSKGLIGTGRLLLSTQGGQETYEFMKAGAIDSLSIGYRVGEYRVDRENDLRIIEKASLMEVSAVTFPMNPQATINMVKGQLPTVREFERILRDAGFSAQQAKAIIAGGFKTIQDVRDAGQDDDNGFTEAMNQLAAKIRG